MQINNINFLNFLFFSEEFFVIVLIFSFFNLIFSILFLELLWPTHFFNCRSQGIFKKNLLNSYQSVILKVYRYSSISFKNFFFL